MWNFVFIDSWAERKRGGEPSYSQQRGNLHIVIGEEIIVMRSGKMMRHWKFWENDGGSFSLFPGNGGLLLEFPIAIRQNLHILLGISLKYNT